MAANKDEIIKIINNVEHPEIANTLSELGMLGDINFDEETKIISFTLNLPMLNIPVAVKNMILNNIKWAIGEKASKLEVQFVAMSEEQRQHFFSLSQKNWKL
jgi:metal-sulfur cluster biosynthetic enzyme